MAKPPCFKVTGLTDVRAFFDAIAEGYHEVHGNPEAQLDYRLGIINRLLEGKQHGCLLEIGCGPADHLFALAPRFERCLGVDISPKMIEVAERKRRTHPCARRIAFDVAAAETLECVGDCSQDVVLMVGVLEHLLDQTAALKQVRRVLKKGGVFVCLTPNARFPWYMLAPLLGWPDKYLSSDRFSSANQLQDLVAGAGLRLEALRSWRFVPTGAMPAWAGAIFSVASYLGSVLAGGLALRAGKLPGPPDG